MNKFLWLRILKTGGTSMKKALGEAYRHPRPDLNNYRIPLGGYNFKRLLFAKKFLYSEKEFEEMFKFAIVRNSYARAASCWQALRGVHYRPKGSFEMFLRGLPYLWKGIDTSINYYYKDAERISTQGVEERVFAMHTAPIVPDLTDYHGNLLIDFVGKLETIDKDFKFICSEIGLAHTPFPHLNKRSKQSYQTCYDKNTLKLVRELYGEDIEMFKYKF